MKKLANPFLAAALAVIVGSAAGLYTFYRAAEIAFEHALRQAPPQAGKVVDVQRERGWDFWTIEIENLSTELKGERERLRKENEQLELRKTQFAAEALELNKVRSDIERLRQEIATKVVEVNTDEVKNVRTLAQTYTNLTPRAAVAILREMDDVNIVKILSVMKPDVVAPIFEEMSRPNGADTSLAQRAAVLSDRLRLMKAAKTASNP